MSRFIALLSLLIGHLALANGDLTPPVALDPARAAAREYTWANALIRTGIGSRPYLIRERGKKNTKWFPPPASANGDSLSVLWWNVQMGEINMRQGEVTTKRQNGEWPQRVVVAPVDMNLLNLADSDLSPDIIVLAEYVHWDNDRRARGHIGGSIFRQTAEYLSTVYDHAIYVPYSTDESSAKRKGGYAIWIKEGLLRSANATPLSWIPDGWSLDSYLAMAEEWTAHWDPEKYDTQMVTLEIEKNGNLFFLAPTHLCQPWSEHVSMADGSLSVSEKFSLGREIAWGKENPHYVQTVSMVRNLERTFGSNLNNDPVFLFGDFNAFESRYKITSLFYDLATEQLDDVFKKAEYSRMRPTFPTPSSPLYGFYPNMRIDHGFASSYLEVERAEVWPLRGSDHYPLYFVIKHRQAKDTE